MGDIKLSVKNNPGHIYAAGDALTINNDPTEKKGAKQPDGVNVLETDRIKDVQKKILVLSSNPRDTTQLPLDREVREIEEGLLRSKHRARFEIKARLAARLNDIRRALLEYEPQIVHFTGHGSKKGLVVEDELGFSVIISSKALAGLFALFSDQVECVILSSCYSKPQAVAINQHINYVIGMNKEISAGAAIEFAVGFYDALGAGRSIEESFKFGSNAILELFPGKSGHLIPLLIKGEKKGVTP